VTGCLATHVEIELSCLRHRFELLGDIPGQDREIHRLEHERDLTRLSAREREQLIDQPRQPVDLLDLTCGALHLSGIGRRIAKHELDFSAQRRERRAQLVGERRAELLHLANGAFQTGEGLVEGGRHFVELIAGASSGQAMIQGRDANPACLRRQSGEGRHGRVRHPPDDDDDHQQARERPPEHQMKIETQGVVHRIERRPHLQQIAPARHRRDHAARDSEAADLGQVGILPLDRPQQFKAVGNYVFRGGLNVGLAFNVISGAPLTPLAANPNYDNGGEIPLAPRGSGILTVDGFRTRTPVLTDTDLHASYTLNAGRARTLTLLADAFNLFNAQTVLMYDEWTELSFQVPNPDFGKPITQVLPGHPPQFQAPFQMRVGARFSF